jgi:ribonuclease HII
MNAASPAPSLDYERAAWSAGYRRVAGLDEAGRGAWAGPVVAAAVILNPGNATLTRDLAGVRDSKLLPAPQRERLFQVIYARAQAVGVGAAPPSVIDACGIVAATREAMRQALQSLSSPADYLLIDYLALPDVPLPQISLPRGDALILSVAAASIVAKVSRDRMMVDLDGEYPGYGFAQHKGYGTAMHQAALASLGACCIHRFSFAPLQGLAANG